MISIAAGMVLSAECINTAVEYLADECFLLSIMKRSGKVKDIAAAGVLISADCRQQLPRLIIFVPGIIKTY